MHSHCVPDPTPGCGSQSNPHPGPWKGTDSNAHPDVIWCGGEFETTHMFNTRAMISKRDGCLRGRLCRHAKSELHTTQEPEPIWIHSAEWTHHKQGPIVPYCLRERKIHEPQSMLCDIYVQEYMCTQEHTSHWNEKVNLG